MVEARTVNVAEAIALLEEGALLVGRSRGQRMGVGPGAERHARRPQRRP